MGKTKGAEGFMEMLVGSMLELELELTRGAVLSASGLVCVLILLCGVRVLDADTLYEHGIVLRWWNWRVSASPGPRTCRLTWISPIPKAETGFHRCLRIDIASLCCCDNTDGFSIDDLTERCCRLFD